MESAGIYLFLLVLFRLAGKRTLSQITTFDFVMLLIIAEVTQQALVAQDYSTTNSLVLIVTLVGLDILISLLKGRFETLDMIVESEPLVIVEKGKIHYDRMRKSRVDEEDILTAAREIHGLARMDQVDYAILERSGGISIVPRTGQD